MGGYTKNIAVIKGLKSGFSADGGALSGLIKVEKYGSYFRAEISLINFAPLSGGRYVVGISDGENTVLCGAEGCECESLIDTTSGFAALVCFVCGGVFPVASAVCGDYDWAAAGIVQEIERQERLSDDGAAYEDEAIAEVNYYEFGDGVKGGGDVCEDTQQKDGRGGGEDETSGRVCAQQENCEKDVNGPENSEVAAHEEKDFPSDKNNSAAEEAEPVRLAHDLKFFERMRGEIERLLTGYPREELLEKTVENSRWVRITYGGGRFYVFGVIYSGEKPAYICYGVPSRNTKSPPASLKGMAGYIPAGDGGFWVMYQDAATGASVKIEAD